MIKLFEQYKSIDEIHKFCSKYVYNNYVINSDNTVDVNGYVKVSYSFLKEIPIYFNNISKDFNCSDNELNSLKGSPKFVGGNFICSFNNIKDLEFCPTYVGGDFECIANDLTSLKGCPFDVNGDFHIKYNPINKIDVECNIKGNIYISNTNINENIINLNQYYLKMLFKHGLDYKIFNDDGSINMKQLEHFINDFKE